VEAYKVLKAIIKPIFVVLFRPTIINAGNIFNEGGIIFAGNHKMALDPLMVALSTKRIVRFLAKKETHEGFTRIFFKALKTIPVDRRNKDKSAINKAMKVLNDGEVISLFPEGTRNKTNDILLPFKFGAVSLAKKNNSPIIPFAITGEYKLFRKGIKIEFDTPIYVSSDMDLEEANQNLKNAVENLIKRNSTK